MSPPRSAAAEPAGATGATRHRWVQLDAVRALIFLLVLVCHTGLSYVDVRPWALHDGNSLGMGLLVLIVSGFTMACFLVISGFGSRALVERAGAIGFLRDRAVRIVLPLLVFLPITRWSMELLWRWGDATMMRQDPTYRPALDEAMATFPFGHLWFLYILALLCVAAVILRRPLAFLSKPMDRLIAAAARTRLLPVAAALPISAAALLLDSFDPWVGIPTPTAIPNPFAVVNFSVAFAIGWAIHRRQEVWHAIGASWHVYSAMAVVTTAARFWTLFGLTAPYASLGLGDRLPIAVWYGLACWASSFAVLALVLRFLRELPRWMSYLGDASYWVYLIHLPLTVAAPILLQPLPLAPAIKLALGIAACLALSLASYELFVRRTVIGVWLGGGRKAPPTTA